VHLVHRGADDTSANDFFETRTNSVTWHSDVTYEKQPPGTTFLYLLDGPTTGGDTLFLNQAEAYRRLSPAFRERLHGLRAVHSGMFDLDLLERLWHTDVLISWSDRSAGSGSE
jgi:sulfonate dioxygenase